MHQLTNKKKIYFYLISFLFISTFFNHNLIDNLKNTFKIDDIEIQNTKAEINDIILSNTSFLLGKNIFFINEKFLFEKLNKLNFIESISVVKKYPSTIKIKTRETDLIAITYINQEKYFLGNNGKFIIGKKFKPKKDLPIIFGNFELNDYNLITQALKKEGIDSNKITKYYFHKSKRWDLFFENNILVKLPTKKINETLRIYKTLIKKNKITPYSTIDLRIYNRAVIKNDQK